MQTEQAPHPRPAPSPLGRLVRWFKVRAIRRRLDELSQQLSTLRHHMAIDAVLAENNRALYMASPALQARMRSDFIAEHALAQDVDALTRALAELEGPQ